jgi:hypothetical protein
VFDYRGILLSLFPHIWSWDQTKLKEASLINFLITFFLSPQLPSQQPLAPLIKAY